MNIFRHGDVGIVKTESDLKGFKKIDRNILAYGEATNHSHKILPKTKTDKVEVYENAKGELAIKVNGIGVITHEEHKTLEIPTGTYMIQREREYDYWAMETRRVID